MSDNVVGSATTDEISISLDIDTVKRVNFASAQNDVAVIKKLDLLNDSQIDSLSKIVVTARADPPVFREKSWVLDRIPPGGNVSLHDLNLQLDLRRLGGLTEAEKGTLTIEAFVEGQLALTHDRTLDMLARDEWGGTPDMAQLLAAFVAPNDPAVASILKVAAGLLEASGHDRAMDGYQSGNPERAWMLAGAIWSAVTGLGIDYAVPAPSFEFDGQKIRGPSRIKSERLATCLDTSLLLAAAFETAGLNPVVLFSKGHAWVGVWIKQIDFGTVVEEDIFQVRKAVQARDLIPIETTLASKRPSVGFDQAVEEGRRRLSEDRESEFQSAIDIQRCRAAQIHPLASHDAAAVQNDILQEIVPAALPKPIDLGTLPGDVVDESPQTPDGRIERWQRKLLDLSLRNRLLNFKDTQKSVPILVPDVGKLEDQLADGHKYKGFALKDHDPLRARTLPIEGRRRIEEEVSRDEFDKGKLCIPLTGQEMNKRFLALHRQAKSDLSEGGTNTLFLAIGFLRWKRKADDEKTFHAPLILIPVKLSRTSVRAAFSVSHHEDDIAINSTLLELLKRDFDLDIPELRGALPTDKSGIDVDRIFAVMRHHVREVAGFEVVEDAALSTFSFAKYLLWKDLVDRTDQLRSNKLVAHLVDNPDKAFELGEGSDITPQNVDRRTMPEDLFLPLPADSSQVAAVAAASTGQDFVLVGPPGTGKSQTITNIIAQCLGQGKTVLFVAEKAAALDVVQRRLKKHGLDDAVLELHSNKAERKRVLAQLGRSWDRAARFKEEEWIKVTKNLKVSRDKLNVYVSELHKIHSQGFSIYQAIGAASKDQSDLTLSFENVNVHDQASYENLLSLAKDVGRIHSIVAQRQPLDLISATESVFGLEKDLLMACKELVLRTRALHQASMSVGRLMGLRGDTESTPERIQLIFSLTDRLSSDAVDLTMAPNIPEAEHRTAFTALSHAFQELERGKSKLSAQYDPDMLGQMPLQDLDINWREAQTKSWPMSKVAKSKVQKMMQSFALSGTVEPSIDLSALNVMARARQALDTNPLKHLVDAGAGLEGISKILTQTTAFEKIMLIVGSEVEEPQSHGQARAELRGIDHGPVRSALTVWSNAAQDYTNALQSFIEKGGQHPVQVPLTQIDKKVSETIGNIDSLNDWTKWNKIRNEAQGAGLGPLVDALDAGILNTSAKIAFQSAYAAWWLPLALNASSSLREFAHWEQEHLIKTFSELDKKMTELAPKEVLRRISHSLPKRESVPKSSELGTLRHQLGMQRPNLPIRSLLAAMPDCFPKLAPCVLMSPLSVAQFLPADQAVFDVVIFDEASQISTWDAVGAIARARQAIIVGDPKQLPPTNFFGRSDGGANLNDGIPAEMMDMPSILDEVTVAGVPTRYLNWHYRSKDESLIAFSNHNYYDGGLVTFPSPRTSGSAVEFHKVDGVYARGSGQINQVEAAAIAGFVKKRLLSWLELDEASRPSLGVITFNSQQQSLILDHLDLIRREDDRFEWFFSDDREEPVIVKNLENIQGDQRDVILFSVTFGPDLAGKLTMGFGALNNDGGEKRLNVGVTRACNEMHIFASIDPDEIDVSRARGRGVRDLKAFLDFAKRGAVALAEQDLGSIGDIENPFEQSIADALSARGWEVRPQIGVSGFRVDLGIVHPDHAGVFIAGVECDGASYHSSATARDRDKTRQAVLEGLGWNILRIWSTDWFRNARSVLDRICDQLTALLEQDRKDRRRIQDLAKEQSEESLADEPPLMITGPDNTIAEEAEFPHERPNEDTGTLFDLKPQRVASSAKAPVQTDPDRFYDSSYDAYIESMVDTIVTQDGPIRFSVLARQIANEHGWQRTGQRIQSRISSLLNDNIRENVVDASFIWPPSGPKRRLPFHGLQDRSIRDVHPAEIASKVDELRTFLERSSDPELDLARKLGIGRLSKDARVYLENCINWRDKNPVLK